LWNSEGRTTFRGGRRRSFARVKKCIGRKGTFFFGGGGNMKEKHKYSKVNSLRTANVR
jgi:hypothetical protein